VVMRIGKTIADGDSYGQLKRDFHRVERRWPSILRRAYTTYTYVK